MLIIDIKRQHYKEVVSHRAGREYTEGGSRTRYPR
jgi:hypothetical protein